MKHNKLVRDKIPQMIISHGGAPVTRSLDDEEFLYELRRKLQEEVDEFRQTGHTQELADILEVVYALAIEAGVSQSQLEEMRQQKVTERGSFGQRVYLIETRTGEGTS
jgi:predicted house-cleaning noncanonical NTP pyrophosphatase (MazG superfamily)